MAKLQTLKPRVEVDAVLTLNRSELAALDALAGYGIDAFIKAFYEKMGTSYLRPHEHGLRSFLEAASHASAGISAARDAERALQDHAIEKGKRKASPAEAEAREERADG